MIPLSLRPCAAGLALAGALSGCSHLPFHKKAPPTIVVAGQPGVGLPMARNVPSRTVETRIGTVRLVGRDGRFVLVETLTGGMINLPEGQELHCRPNGEPGAELTGVLRLGHEQRQQFGAADVLTGSPHAGDAVFAGGPSAIVSSAPPLLTPNNGR